MFKIIHDIAFLDENQRKQYLSDYSEFLGLNPLENRIDTIWLNTDTVRTLVAYCRRGTTDILREIHGIDVESLVKEDGPGYVSYKATGRNRRGRVEMAIGAYHTGNLTGDRLAAAIATAQTRALRRLTLQFVGGGLLDESEVNNQPIEAQTLTLITPPIQPEIKPNTNVGRLSLVSTVEHALGPVPSNLKDITAVEKANQILAQSEPIPEKKKRGRKRKNVVDMGDALPVEPLKSANADIQESQRTVTSNIPVCPDCNASMAADERLDMYLCVKHGRVDTNVKPSTINTNITTAPAPTTPTLPPPKAISLLTEDEQKQVKARLAPYWVDILPKGGMTADDGISIWGKLIKFANSFYADQPDYKKWPFAAWEVFFEFLDEYNGKNGPASLVAYINEKIK